MWMNVSESKDTRFRTVIDFLVALTLFLTCLYLYSKWNDVPKHTDKIEVSCLNYRQPLSDTVSEWSPVAIINYEIKKLERRFLAAKISGRLVEERAKDLSVFISNHPNQFDEKMIGSQLETSAAYQNALLDSLKTYTGDSISWWIDNPSEDLFALFFFQINCKWNISDHKDYTSDPFLNESPNAKAIGFWGYRDSAYYQNHYFLRLDKNKVGISDKEKVEGIDNPLAQK